MFMDELKCIEILISNAYYGHDLKTQIKRTFDDFSDFKKPIHNLFNLQSIEILLRSYTKNPSFNREHFLFTGIIPKRYPDKIPVPSLDPYFIDEPSRFYEELINALKDGNYTFTERGNILVSSEMIESEIPSVWLYRLAQTYKEEKHTEIFLYNKNKENDITDETSLTNCLHHTKVFACTLSSETPNIDFKKSFNRAKTQVTSSINNENEVKINDIIEAFESKLNPKINCEITKLKLDFSLITMIVKKSNKMGLDFYSKTLKEQQKYIKTWLIEYLNSNIKCNETTVAHLLRLLQGKNDDNKELRNDIILSLLNTYIILIRDTMNDYTNVTLSDFKITNYMNDNLQTYLLNLNEVIKKINSSSDAKASADTITKIETTIQTIKQLDDEEEADLIRQKQEELSILFDKHTEESNLKNELMARRNTLQNLIHFEQENSELEIAFNNDAIISFLTTAIRNGETYINPLDKDEIVFEIHNPELGKNIFQAKISIKKAINFITMNNTLLESDRLRNF